MKENNILISVLVPTYNRVKYLGECLDSIVEQK
ncbi:glycosyltransferase [bacterium]|nr:glycosyltransferase [bacterium]